MIDKEYQLLSELAESSEKSFKKLFMNYHNTLFRFICNKVREADIAEDIIQETFVRVWKNRNKINPNKSFFSYIVRVSNNLCIDYFRHQRVKNKSQQNIIEYGKSHFTILKQKQTLEYIGQELVQLQIKSYLSQYIQ